MNIFSHFNKQHAVDVTAFLGQWPHRLTLSTEGSDLTEMADQYGIDRFCVSHIASIFGHDTWTGNEALLTESSKDERLWPFVILNPQEEAWSRELAWAADQGAKGIRLLPGYHGYELSHLVHSGFIAEVKKYKMPLQIMIRLEDERLHHPRFQVDVLPLHTVAELLIEAGNTPILLGGLRPSEWETIRRHLPVDQSFDHVYGDLWYANGPLAVMEFICQQGWAKHFVYGSCAPIQTAEATMLQLATANISEQDRYDLCRGNSLRFLGIPEKVL